MLRPFLIALLLCAAGLHPLAAQRHAVTDQSLARSILFAAPPLPLSTHQMPGDTAHPGVHRRERRTPRRPGG